MSSEAPLDSWRTLPFEDFVEVQRGFDLPKGKRSSGPVPVVGASGPVGTHDEAAVSGPGVTIGRAASIGVATWVDDDFWPLNTTLFIKDYKGNDPKFVYYVLDHLDFTPYDSGSVQPMLNRNYIAAVPVRVPGQATQRAIVSVLSSLEELAAAAKKAGELATELLFTGSTEVLAAVTEDEVAPIGNVLDIVGGSTPRTSDSSYWENGTYCWTTPRDLSGSTVPVLVGTERKITKAGLDMISSGLLPVGAVLMSSRAPVGYLAIARTPVAVNQGYIAIKPHGRIPSSYILCWLHANMDLIKSRAGGTTFSEISKRNFRPIPMAVPDDDKLAEFDAFASPLLDLMENKLRLHQTLTQLRDALLPKLISGELTVQEAEERVEEVA